MIVAGLYDKAVSILEYILPNSSAVAKNLKANIAVNSTLMEHYKDAMLLEGIINRSGFAYSIGINQHTDLGNLLFNCYRIFFSCYDVSFNETYWVQYSRVLEKPAHEILAGMKTFNNDLKGGSFFMGLYGLRTLTLDNSYTNQIIEAMARLRTSNTAIAATTYKQDHGDYPSALTDLVPAYLAEIPVDPFTGESMLMKATKNGLIIYSVGNNLKDDHGANYDRAKGLGDVSFYLGDAYNEYRVKPGQEKAKKKSVAAESND